MPSTKDKANEVIDELQKIHTLVVAVQSKLLLNSKLLDLPQSIETLIKAAHLDLESAKEGLEEAAKRLQA